MQLMTYALNLVGTYGIDLVKSPNVDKDEAYVRLRFVHLLRIPYSQKDAPIPIMSDALLATNIGGL